MNIIDLEKINRLSKKTKFLLEEMLISGEITEQEYLLVNVGNITKYQAEVTNKNNREFNQVYKDTKDIIFRLGKFIILHKFP